ncbi:MAG TPA: tRNA (adenosine(37)-N6)-threonylcarbamoyltransferase complex dimerization subunit type 1 TsaB [Flavobacteriaceae bacterium]|nr:tRNA (adenosine(37)-N6)-threonylcarbamoyltransferase complex dimerization subunit type 1 TsaB [Flavobacteriaceae bacterium]MCB9212298.1 tRNA (adenosine(37)-N6)-threonylcarbamoyltransferase complex dimerization subunit type 1 TsaB [Alteromonas sp.]HPF10323.1 tRNA (adenosine(37)-N6)-threonylcarbamoyltransferase complex dimerization subunit type 1 TsaB [Flavobacteriaceae bacterium]HQU20387.1 tRNA (adenosine(37)-N6)-threonylcarbamoyltransferase complex dimerization subunit type 1 TsaB [Flavobacte
MATILCLETATINCSVALSQNGNLSACKEETNKNYSHAEQLHLFIDSVAQEAGISLTALDAIAVGMGPGSYTGLRIGVSAAKGLCYALDVPLIAISTLALLASQSKQDSDFIVPMLDARRMEVYAAVFNAEKQQLRSIEAEIVTENSYQEYLKQGTVTFIGNGMDKFQSLCRNENAKFEQGQWPSACSMSVLAEEKYRLGQFEDVAYFEPFYLKDFMGKTP